LQFSGNCGEAESLSPPPALATIVGFQEKGNYFLNILLNLDIRTIEVYMARKYSPLLPEERFRPAQQLFF
jgi:hypothetical protein